MKNLVPNRTAPSLPRFAKHPTWSTWDECPESAPGLASSWIKCHPSTRACACWHCHTLFLPGSHNPGRDALEAPWPETMDYTRCSNPVGSPTRQVGTKWCTTIMHVCSNSHRRKYMQFNVITWNPMDTFSIIHFTYFSILTPQSYAARLQLVGANGFGAEIHHRGLVTSFGLGALQHLPEEGLEASGAADPCGLVNIQ